MPAFLAAGLTTPGGALGSCLSKIEKYMEENKEVYPLMNAFSEFVNCASDDERMRMLRNDSGMGLMIFCEGALHPFEQLLADVRKDEQGGYKLDEQTRSAPVHVLEIDCRGSVEQAVPFVIRIGEIKSSRPCRAQMLRAIIVLQAARVAVPLALEGKLVQLAPKDVLVYGVTFLPRRSRYQTKQWRHKDLPGIVLRFELL